MAVAKALAAYQCADFCPLQPGQKNIAEFRCNDGMCIKIDGYCDGTATCADASDESHCHTTDQPEFDCAVGDKDWVEVWTPSKKTWCCENEGKHCPHGTKTKFHCLEGVANFEDWPVEKRHFCCDSESIGCTTSPELDAFTVTSTVTSTITTQTMTTTQTQTITVTTTITSTSTTHSTTRTVTSSTKTGTTTTTTTASTTTRTTTTLDPVTLTMRCSTRERAWEPLDMAGTTLSKEQDVAACQRRCAKTEGCAHYSFWEPAGDCHLQDENAFSTIVMSFVAGPASCLEMEKKFSFLPSGLGLRGLQRPSAPTGVFVAAGAACTAFVAALLVGVAGWRFATASTSYSDLATDESPLL